MMPSKFLFIFINAIQIQLLNYRYFEQQDRQSIVPTMSLGDIIVKFILYSIFIFGYYIGYDTAISARLQLLLLLTARSTPTWYFCCCFLFLTKKSKLKFNSFFQIFRNYNLLLNKKDDTIVLVLFIFRIFVAVDCQFSIEVMSSSSSSFVTHV